MRNLVLVCFALMSMACTDPEPDEPKREGLTDGGSYYVYWDSIPNTIPFNEPFKLTAMVHDGDDHTQMHMDKELFVDATMPSHGHGMETLPEVTLDEGIYTVDGMLFHMAGEWEIAFAVSDGETVERIAFPVDCCES